MHYHPTPEVFFQEQGNNSFSCPDSSFVLQPGEACLIHAGLPHGEIGSSSPSSPFRNIVICFEQTHLRILEAGCQNGKSPEVHSGDTYFTTNAALALGYANRITKISSRPNSTSRLHINGLFQAFIAIILETLEAGQEHHKPYDIRIVHAQDLISSELGNPKLSVKYLSERLSCSPDHFTRLFRQYTGSTPNQYIREQRIQYASTLLQDPSINISQVAWSSGFSSLNYFSRAFQQERKCSASEYRKRQRAGIGI